MNKTLTINLSGMVFHIDENAYELLRNYLEKLKLRFTGNSGIEIISDIETRIAEMFQEKISSSKNVITLMDVESVITLMGNPEDIGGTEPEQKSITNNYNTDNASPGSKKRFFRNPDDKILGGVCSGISSYFDIDPIWMRLAFALLFVFAGSGLLLYIILWIIIPVAKTATERLEMRGEAINISNIERNIREEMENVKGKFEKMGQEFKSGEYHQKIKSSTDKVIDFLKDIVKYVVRFLSVIVGLIVTLFSLVVIVALAIGVFSVIGLIPNTTTNFPSDYIHYLVTANTLWFSITGLILVIGIPFIILLLNGIKLLFRVNLNLKSVGIVMLIFWMCGIGICIWNGVVIAGEFKSKAMVSEKNKISLPQNKTIRIAGNKISSGNLDGYDNGNRMNFDGTIITFGEGQDSVMCNDVRLDINQSNNDSVYLVSEYSSRGKTIEEARGLARKINYSYSIKDSSIIFNNAFNINNAERYRVQSIRLTLKIPVGYKIVLDKSLEDIIYDLESVSIIDEDMINHTWQMTTEGLKCLDCKENEKQLEMILPEDGEKEKVKI